MLSYLVRRILLVIPTLFGVSVVVFVLTRVVPADPALAAAGIGASQQKVEAIRRELGLDKPLPVQYAYYIRDLSRGDLGISIYSGLPVSQDIVRFFPATIELSLTAFFLVCAIGIPLGIFAATHHGKNVDLVSRVSAVGTTALPTFWLALILQLVFFHKLHWFPLIGRVTSFHMRPEHITGFFILDSLLTGNWASLADTLYHMFLPLVALVAARLAIVVRLTRVCVLDVLSLDYIRTARAKGLSNPRVVYKHSLRNAAIPILTELGMQFSWMLGGSAVVEMIFVWPGLGFYTITALNNMDFNTIIAFTLIVTGLFLASNLLVDLTYSFLNPRIRFE